MGEISNAILIISALLTLSGVLYGARMSSGAPVIQALIENDKYNRDLITGLQEEIDVLKEKLEECLKKKGRSYGRKRIGSSGS